MTCKVMRAIFLRKYSPHLKNPIVVVLSLGSYGDQSLVKRENERLQTLAHYNDGPLMSLHICFHNQVLLTSLCTLMSYLVVSRNGEESFNNFLGLGPDLDHLRGVPRHR